MGGLYQGSTYLQLDDVAYQHCSKWVNKKGRTHLLLALVIWQLPTHPARDGEQFLLQIEASNI